MPKKGEKLSPEHLAKMKAGRDAKKRPSATPDDALIPGTKSGKGTMRPMAMKEATKPLIGARQVSNLTKCKKNSLIENSAKEPVRKTRGVQPSGEPMTMESQTAVVNRNTGPSTVISNQLPQQKEAIKAVLAETKKSGSKIKSEAVDPSPPNKTVDEIPSTDTKALEGNKTPFSFQALRNRLLC